jgi:hypothetical protein
MALACGSLCLRTTLGDRTIRGLKPVPVKDGLGDDLWPRVLVHRQQIFQADPQAFEWIAIAGILFDDVPLHF